ncbi:Phage integrase family protein [Micromonospora echinaurantiaca]|uniref:Phage integrase family protein n=1 Tax=Micromonospora echinaurantiaca TaxID=47857 RepID=A0A1C5KBG0_9ACTN|nr:tyrosine-type recombinase/integrase [Micromonospora echinaurantiaca]SCG80143.1 Phage integrase family protein [Micromonospora echinaurantiaca]
MALLWVGAVAMGLLVVPCGGALLIERAGMVDGAVLAPWGWAAQVIGMFLALPAVVLALWLQRPARTGSAPSGPTGTVSSGRPNSPPSGRAIAYVATKAVGGMRFHDLRHACTTWLVTDGVPIYLAQRVMGHAQASTTLNRYTISPDDYAARILAAVDSSAAPCCL